MPRANYLLYTILLSIVTMLFKDVPLVIVITVIWQLMIMRDRVRNTGASGYWVLLSPIPVLNAYTYFNAMFIPTGYYIKTHSNYLKKDTWFYFGICCVVFVTCTLTYMIIEAQL